LVQIFLIKEISEWLTITIKFSLVISSHIQTSMSIVQNMTAIPLPYFFDCGPSPLKLFIEDLLGAFCHQYFSRNSHWTWKTL